MKTDIQIARECELKPIGDIAEKLGIDKNQIEPYGRYMAKVPFALIDDEKVKKSKLILVTAISPTKVGIGKTTVSIGLAMGLNKIGKNASVLKGVTIGDNSIVGMSTIVTKDVEEGTIVVGNPANVVKRNITWSRERVM